MESKGKGEEAWRKKYLAHYNYDNNPHVCSKQRERERKRARKSERKIQSSSSTEHYRKYLHY